MLSRKFKIIILCLGLTIIIGIISGQNYRNKNLPSLRNTTFTDFKLPDIYSGEVIDTKYFSKSSVYKQTIIHFFATWCPSCVPEIKKMLNWKIRHPDVLLILVAVKDFRIDVKKNVGELKSDLRQTVFVLDDSASLIMGQYGVKNLPETFIFDGKGALIKSYVGPDSWVVDK